LLFPSTAVFREDYTVSNCARRRGSTPSKMLSDKRFRTVEGDRIEVSTRSRTTDDNGTTCGGRSDSQLGG